MEFPRVWNLEKPGRLCKPEASKQKSIWKVETSVELPKFHPKQTSKLPKLQDFAKDSGRFPPWEPTFRSDPWPSLRSHPGFQSLELQLEPVHNQRPGKAIPSQVDVGCSFSASSVYNLHIIHGSVGTAMPPIDVFWEGGSPNKSTWRSAESWSLAQKSCGLSPMWNDFEASFHDDHHHLHA